MICEARDSGCRVWATRPEAQNSGWIATLTRLGYPVVNVPLLSIESVRDPAAVQAVKELILNFDQFQKVIFVSQNAVQSAFAWLTDYWPQLPDGTMYFAVGRKTADQARNWGITVYEPGQTMDSDALLAMPALQSVWGDKILICRGRGGLPRIGEVLHQRGAIVRYCELYERCLPGTAQQDVAKALFRSGDESTTGHVIPLFSGETLQNLIQVLQKLAYDPQPLKVIVPGRRVADLAQSNGFESVTCAFNASEPAMLEALSALINQDAL